MDIEVSVDRVEQLLGSELRSPFRARHLHDDAERFLLKKARARARGTPVRLVIYLPPRELARARNLAESIRRHFEMRREQIEDDLDETWRSGHRSLVTGFIVLSLALALAEGLTRWLPSALSISFAEGLRVLGWVALWRPAELLMWEWRELRREARLLEVLSTLEVDVRAAAEPGFSGQPGSKERQRRAGDYGDFGKENRASRNSASARE